MSFSPSSSCYLPKQVTLSKELLAPPLPLFVGMLEKANREVAEALLVWWELIRNTSGCSSSVLVEMSPVLGLNTKTQIPVTAWHLLETQVHQPRARCV